MPDRRLSTWLRWLRAAATFVFVAALCLAVALLVIAFIPGSPVAQDLPVSAVSGLDRLRGLSSGVAVDPSGWLGARVDDASLGQRLLHLLTVLPGLVLVAEIARRMGRLVRTAQETDPFTAEIARALVTTGRLTAVAGLATWALSQVAQGILAATMLTASATSVTFHPHHSPLGWLAVGLIFAAIGQVLHRGVAMRAELDAVI